jgi:hypothetical protein
MKPMEKKKRHHYVPRTYLRQFCGASGRLHIYRKDAPGTPFHQSPDSAAFRNHYYSQPLPQGGIDSNTLESFFSQVESKWPAIVGRIATRGDLRGDLEHIFNFMALQKARVPASRDATEAMYAAGVKSRLRGLDAAGKLPPKPLGYENILDRVEVSIDPHQSIHAMIETIRGAGEVFARMGMGMGILHNLTESSFVTSDNPVVWFDPSVSDTDLRPYVLQPDGPVALLFPVTPSFLIYGSSSIDSQFTSTGFGTVELRDAAKVERINRQICRFSYEAISRRDRDTRLWCANTPTCRRYYKRESHQPPVARFSSMKWLLEQGRKSRNGSLE